MNLNFIKYTIASSIVLSSAVYAGEGGSCHFHGNKPVAQSVVIDCANQRKDSLVKSGKIEASWANIKHSTIDKIDGKKGPEWKIIYENPSAGDKTKQRLFMYYALAGHFIAANHTGN